MAPKDMEENAVTVAADADKPTEPKKAKDASMKIDMQTLAAFRCCEVIVSRMKKGLSLWYDRIVSAISL